jgi:DNA processing protein
VCAVPGPITSSASIGCHILLQAGAELVTRAEEIREIAGRAGELADEQPRPSDALDVLTDTERQVYEALPGRGTRTPDEIAIASGLPTTDVLGPLALLEIAGLIERHEGRWRLGRRSA